MFHRKPAALEWRRHCLLSSGKQRSVDFNGLILFADGAFSALDRGFLRGEEICDVRLGHLVLHRARDSDLLKITNEMTNQVLWLEYEFDVFMKWHHVLPVGAANPTDEPTPLPKRSKFGVLFERRWMAACFGFAGEPCPDFGE